MKKEYVYNVTKVVNKKHWMAIKVDFPDNSDWNTVVIIIKTRGWSHFNSIGQTLNNIKDKWCHDIYHGMNDKLLIFDIFNEYEFSELRPRYKKIEDDLLERLMEYEYFMDYHYDNIDYDIYTPKENIEEREDWDYYDGYAKIMRKESISFISNLITK